VREREGDHHRFQSSLPVALLDQSWARRYKCGWESTFPPKFVPISNRKLTADNLQKKHVRDGGQRGYATV